MADEVIRSVSVKFGADMSEYRTVVNKMEEDLAQLPSRLERKMSYSRGGNKVMRGILPPVNPNEMDRYAEGIVDQFSSSFVKARARKRGPTGASTFGYSENLSVSEFKEGAGYSPAHQKKLKKSVDTIFDAVVSGVNSKAEAAAKEARRLAMQDAGNDKALGRSVYRYTKRDLLAEGRYRSQQSMSNMDWLDQQEDMLGLSAAANRRKRRRQIRGIKKLRAREAKATSGIDNALRRGRAARENQRRMRMRARAERSRLMYHGGSSLFSFLGGSAGAMAGSTLGGGVGTVIGRGMMGGGLGASIGMMAGGPMGALAGGALGLAGGGMFGMLEAGVHAVMELFVGGISRAMSLLHMGASRVIELGMEYERTLAKFGILAGGADKGKALYGGIEKLSTRTPYRTGTLASGAELLLGYGVKPDNIVPTLSRLGDIAGGDATRFDRLALAFGQVMSQGRLLGQELRQFAEAGVGARDFADTLGISVFQLKAKMEAGAVPASVMVATINRLTEGTGRFAGVNEATFKTVSGQWNSLVGTAEMVGRRVGESLFKKLNLADMLGQGRQSLEQFMSGGGIERLTTTIADWAKGVKEFGINLYEHALPGLKLAGGMGEDLAKSFMGVGDGLDKAGLSWKTFQKGLVDGVKFIGDSFIGFARLMQTLAPHIVDTGVEGAETLQSVGKLGTGKDAARRFLNFMSPPESGYSQRLIGTNWGDQIFGSTQSPALRQGAEVLKKVFAGMDLDSLQNRFDRTYQNVTTGAGSNLPVQSQFIARSDFQRRLASGMAAGGKVYFEGHWLDAETAQSIVDTRRRMSEGTGGGTFADRIASDKTIDPAISKMATAMEHSLMEGLTPLDQFRISMERIGIGRAFRDETGRPGIDRYTSRALTVQAYNELKKALPSEEFRLPPSAARDTAEAVRIATESVFDHGIGGTTQEQIKRNLDLIKEDAKRTADSNKVIADYFERNPNPLMATPTGFE